MLAWREGVSLGGAVKFYGLPILERAERAQILIGSKTVLCSDPRYTALGTAHPVILRAMRAGAVIRIGKDCGLSGTVICAAHEVSIGDECLIGADVAIFDTDFHAMSASGRRYNRSEAEIAGSAVRIGRNVFIGTGVKVCKGVSIGDNSVIGAGAIVTKDIPENVIAAGNPAQVIRQL